MPCTLYWLEDGLMAKTIGLFWVSIHRNTKGEL